MTASKNLITSLRRELPSIIGLLIVMLCFQNCSPIQSKNSESAVSPTDTVGPVDIVEPVDTSPSLCADQFLCANQKSMSNGTLYAIVPSSLDSRTKDLNGTATVQDQNLGFGYHVVAVPKNYDPNKGLWIHFAGTYGRPYNQKDLSFSSADWMNEILGQGYTVIQIAYDNRTSVNDTCIAPNPAYNHNNCAGEIRQETLTGVDLSPYRTTDAYNSVDYRLQVLLTYLQAHSGVKLPANLNPNNVVWSDITVSGHSQGGNLAYYVAKNRGVKFACMLGSPYDVGDSVNPGSVPIADWFTTGVSLTPVNRLGHFVTKEDDNYSSFHAGALFVGMTYGQEAFETSQPPYHNSEGEEINGHAASVGDPKLASLRAQACFRPLL